MQNTTCGSAHSFSPDDGHNDARNMLKLKFDNKHQISYILLVSLSSPYVHDARSQEPKIRITYYTCYLYKIRFLETPDIRSQVLHFFYRMYQLYAEL